MFMCFSVFSLLTVCCISLFRQNLSDIVASYLSRLSHFVCGIVSIRVCASFRYLFVDSLQFDCISCNLGFSDYPIICYRVC